MAVTDPRGQYASRCSVAVYHLTLIYITVCQITAAHVWTSNFIRCIKAVLQGNIITLCQASTFRFYNFTEVECCIYHARHITNLKILIIGTIEQSFSAHSFLSFASIKKKSKTNVCTVWHISLTCTFQRYSIFVKNSYKFVFLFFIPA
jgi:hypothetical protein